MVCINLHVDDKIVTLATTHSDNEISTMLALITAINFQFLNISMLQNIFYYSVMSLGDSDGASCLIPNRLPLIKFKDTYASV